MLRPPPEGWSQAEALHGPSRTLDGVFVVAIQSQLKSNPVRSFVSFEIDSRSTVKAQMILRQCDAMWLVASGDCPWDALPMNPY